ncbi:MAG: DUF2802 domain-containing protein [Gammaproteobacteria bacterium]|nr:DUF2802 domain-containing protein [Gammaproteobacteria bacterium]
MFSPSPLIGLIVFIVLGCVALCGYRLGTRRRRNRLDAIPSLDQTTTEVNRGIEELRQQLNILSSSTLGVAARVEKLAGDVSSVRDRVDEVEEGSAVGAYTPAIKMAESGCRVEDLVENFGLSLGEAELLRKLHGARHSAGARGTTRH